MKYTPIPPDRLPATLESLPGWTLDDDKLHRVFEFRDFRAAFGFMASCALAAEAMNHHPEWRNVYRTVEVWLSTHATGGITEHDVKLAREMSARAAG